jgi:hypothetical protein
MLRELKLMTCIIEIYVHRIDSVIFILGGNYKFSKFNK